MPFSFAKRNKEQKNHKNQKDVAVIPSEARNLAALFAPLANQKRR
jgi:hypothetical protein